MAGGWLNLFLRFSGYVYQIKQKIVNSGSWTRALPYVFLLLLTEVVFIIISLPLYLAVSPDKLQERGLVFPRKEKEYAHLNVYIIRRKISLTTIFSAGGVFLFKFILIGAVSTYLLGAQALLAATQDWTFDSAGDYTVSSSTIEFVGGAAQLKNLGGTVLASTTNSGFDANSTGWTFVNTWSEPAGQANTGSYVSSGGNTNGYINVLLNSKKSSTIAAYWYQAFTTNVNSPDTATLNLDWKSITYNGNLLTSYRLYAFIDTTSGNPSTSTAVWDSGNISAATAWASIATTSITSKIPTAGTYYLKIGAYATFSGGGGSVGNEISGFDNVKVRWTENTTSYDSTTPTVRPNSSLTMAKTVSWNSFTETATKNGGEIYYQLSSDDGSTWKYWTGSAWGAAGASNYNTASVVNTNIPTFATSSNKIMWKAFLSSNGSQQVILDNISVGYTENTPPAISNLAPAQDTGNGNVRVDYTLTDTNDDPSSLVTYEYSLTGAFAGEQFTMTASTTDPAHQGVSGLTASPGGTAHTFVWDARTDIGDIYDASVYVRMRANDGIASGAYATSSAFAVDYVSSTVSNVAAVQTLGTSTVAVTYDLSDDTTDNIYVEMEISGDGGATWTVPTTSASGAIGAGVSVGSGKTITWDAGVDYSGQQKSDMQVRVRAEDKWQNQGDYTSSTNFSLDTLAPATLTTVNLISQPNAGDTTVLIGGSFTEVNPNTNDFYVAVSGGAYSGATSGTTDTATPSNQLTSAGATLDGNDYVSGVKIIHIDDYGRPGTNENTSPNTAYKYVKPYTPQAPTLSNPVTTRLDLQINPHASEASDLEYAIFVSSTNQYVQSDGTLGASAVWQTPGTGAGQWGNGLAVSGQVRVTGLSSPVANYIFNVKSRNTSDVAHAASSESAFSAAAQITNTAPSISVNTAGQTTDGTQYVTVAYTGTDAQGDLNNLNTYQYSQDNSTWFIAAEKSGVGSEGVSGLVFLSAGSAHNFMWDSGSDLPMVEDDTVYFRLRSTDTLASSSLASATAFKVDNKASVVANVSAVQNAGARTVAISYDLTDNNNSTVEINISQDGGSTWTVATTSVSGDIGAGITPGTGKSIIWNAGTDFDNQYQTDMRVQIRARDVYGNQGNFTSSANFTVDTNDPVVSNVTAAQDSGVDIFTFNYDVSEDAGNVSVVLAISSDGGSTWTVATTTAAGDIGTVTPGTNKTITWNGATDYNNQEKTNMKIRVTATDGFSNNSATASANFSLDTFAPRVTSVVASQTAGTTNVVITYTLADQNNSLVQIDISEDGGLSWIVATTSASGDVGSGVSAGSKTITWAAGTDFDEQQQSDIRVRVRAKDTYNHQSDNTESANFALDTLNPTTNVLADLLAQPNAGDTTALIGGSFTEANPSTNDFYVALNGGVYGTSTAGTTNTASPANLATAVGATLDGNDYISKLKITHSDDFGQSYDNENLTPSTTYKYVKPYTPQAPTVDNPTVGTVDVLINPHASETAGLEYAIFETSQSKYVQANGTLGASAVWQTLGTGAGQWGQTAGLTGKITVNGLTTDSYLYQFKVKSRNTSDAANAASSESALSAGASSVNQSPTITLGSVGQSTDGTKYVTINYTGTDLESENVDFIKHQYSTNNSTWFTMTEKSGVGSDGTTGIAFSAGGSSHDFMWDVGTDLANTEDDTVYIRLQGNDGTSDGNIAASSAFTVDTKNPVISAVVGAQTLGTNNVAITYTLTDLSTSTVELNISENSGLDWTVTSTSVTGDVGVGVSPGSGKSITWNAGADFDSQEQSDLRARARALDAFGNQGSYAQSSDFSLDTKDPAVSNVAAVQNVGTTTVVITYDLSDANNSTVYLDISDDNGATWTVATTTLAGHVGNGVTPGSKTITWNAAVDYVNHQQSDMVVRVRAVDPYSNSSGNVSSAAWSVDTSAPGVNTVAAVQTLGTQNVSITYNLVDANNATVVFEISDDNGSTWTVPHSTATGDFGTGITPGTGKTITWNAGADFSGNQNSNMMARVRASDIYNNDSDNVNSSAFGLDTLAPATNVAADLQAQPNAGDTTALIGGSFIEVNPNTNDFYVAINGGAYGSATAGSANTASPANQATAVGVTLDGNDYISKVKIVHTDDYNSSSTNENTSPAVAYKYVKPYTPNAPTVNNPQNSSVDVAVNANVNEATNLQYAIYENTTGLYVQANGTLASSSVWQTTSTWGVVTVIGLTSPVANYSFKVKSRNPSDTLHAASSESAFSTSAAITNSAPSISISSASQQLSGSYVLINYTGTDVQNDTNNLTSFQYSINGTNWFTMTEKSGVGSSGTSSLVFSSTGTAYNFAWDVAADLPNQEQPTVYVRLQSSDTLASSNLAQSSAFAVDSLGPVVSNINTSQTAGSNTVTITYDLSDSSGANNYVTLLISSDSGSTWTVATTTLTGHVGAGVSAGTARSVSWNAGVDFNNQENSTMQVEISGTDQYGNVGNFTTSSNFAIDTKSPVVSAVSASQVAGTTNVTISYNLADNTPAGHLVEFEVSSDSGSTWVVPALTATGNIGAGQTTGTGTFIWYAGTDFSGQAQTDMRVRVRSTDYFGHLGSYSSSADFLLDTKSPVVSSVTATQTAGGGSVTINYNLSDDTSSGLIVAVDISDNGGSSWIVATGTLAGNIGSSQTTGNGKTITWSADIDYPGQYNTAMQVRARATDSWGNVGVNSASVNFTVDTKEPVISGITAAQTIGSDNIVINYNLADDTSSNLTVALDISSNNGSTWTVATTTLSGDIGSGLTAGSGKSITWNAGVDFSDQYNVNMKVRVRALDNYYNSASSESGAFSVDTKNPATLVTSDLTAQPHAGDTMALIGGSFSEDNPNTNDFYLATNGGAYGSATAGDTNTATPSDQNTAAGIALDGNDYISKVKIVHTDDFGHSFTNENLSPNNKYVKPYTPAAPTVDNPTSNTVDVTVNKNTNEVTGLEYAIFASSTNQYVQADGALGASAVWQTGATWGAVTVTGLSAPVSNYVFKTKSRNSADAVHATSSESEFSAGTSSGNTAPSISIASASQNSGTDYVTINYVGTDNENNSVNLTTFEYSLDGIAWTTMTEKSGVGSSGTTGLAFTAGGTNLNFVWNAGADLSNVEDSSVYARLRADDGVASGNLEQSPSFALDLKGPVVANVSAAQQAGSSTVLISYDLSDLTATSNTVALDISQDGGATWTVATSTLSGNIGSGQSVGSGKTITWNAGVDFSNHQQTDMRVRVRGVDNFANQGGFEQSSDFTVDTSAPTVSDITAAQTLGTNDVLIYYSLVDFGSATVALDISDDNGATWTVTDTSVSGDIGAGVTTGTSKLITWNAGADFAGQSQSDMRVRIRAIDAYGNSSGNVTSASFSVDTLAPVVSAVTASQSSGSGVVVVNYILTDDSVTNNTVEFAVSNDNGATWTVATTTASGNVGSGQGVGSLSINWNPGVDYAGQLDADMKVRVRARDAYNNQGGFGSSPAFSVDTQLPILSNLTAVQTVSTTNVVFTYDLSENTTTSTVALQISQDGGLTWTVTATSLSGAVGAVNSGAGQTISWNAGADFAGQEQTDMRVRLIATDAFGNASAYFSSADFVLDTAAPSGLASLTKFSGTTTEVTMNWTPATDANFNHYELWHGASQADVIGRSGAALKWDATDDTALSSALTISTVITGLNLTGDYYVKIWAVDDYDNEVTISDVKVFSTPVVTPVTPPSGGGGGGGVISTVRTTPISKPILTPLTSPTNNTTVNISGLAEPRARVDLYDNGVFVGRLDSVADDNGQFSQNFTFGEGTHILTARAVDFSNNTSDPSDSIILVITFGPPTTPTILSPLNNGRITETTPIISGIAAPNTQVEINLGDNQFIVTTDANGAWQLVLPSELALGTGAYTFTARAVDNAGNRSGATSVTVTRIPAPIAVPIAGRVITPSVSPVAPIGRATIEATEIASLPVPTVVEVAPAVVGDNFVFSGIGLPNKEVLIYVHSDQALIYQTVADNQGRWQVTHSQLSAELTPGEHTIYAVSVDPVAKVKTRPSLVSSFTVKKNMWVAFFNSLNFQTTTITLAVALLAMLWLYQIKKAKTAKV